MKKIIVYIFAFGLLIFSSCASSGPAAVDKPGSANVVKVQDADEEAYELTIIDPGFQRWFVGNGRPVNYHSPDFYAGWNRRYVQQWNQLANQQISSSPDYPFQNQIDYDPNINYGVVLDHELYWYFRYIESMYGARYNFGFGRRNF